MQEDENPKDRHGKLFSWEVTQFIILTLKKTSFPLTCIPGKNGPGRRRFPSLHRVLMMSAPPKASMIGSA
ncbi:uncharacterized protein L203_103048 [Cryptococcus depauperatus CBS 7841]|uniref:Uncharacterized protein n=1 Tax=Cryptococcus depauperatus CBS 7841 TaxID=1295531 RepID=A0AAJ8JT05_9TREE